MRRGDDTSKAVAAANAEYDNFLGAPRRARQYDLVTHKWYEFTVYGPKGPADRVAPATGEESMMSEEWVEPRKPRVEQEHSDGRELRKQRTLAKHRDLQAHIAADIVEHGWSTVLHIGRRLKMNSDQVLRYVKEFEGEVFVRRAVNKSLNVWGVIGVHDMAAEGAD